jgi:protein-S-isoprenylcysteine O-methyltransferase Ste14
MLKVLKAENGMNIGGQGPKIVRVALPFLVAAVLVHRFAPHVAALQLPKTFSLFAGILFMVLGLTLWLTGAVQLLKGFPKGKLVRTGAYGVCRHPVYSSYIIFILPGISFLTGTWVYFAVALILYLSLALFIGKEEEELRRVFGHDYEEYAASVCCVVPFVKPMKK